MSDDRVWTVYEHGGGRTVSSEQTDAWKTPILVVPLTRAESAEARRDRLHAALAGLLLFARGNDVVLDRIHAALDWRPGDDGEAA